MIHDNVVLEKDCVVEDFSTLGYPAAGGGGAPLVIRRGSLIRSYSLFYEGSEFGARMVTGHRVTVLEMPGRVKTCRSERSATSRATARSGITWMHSSVHVGQGSDRRFLWLFPTWC